MSHWKADPDFAWPERVPWSVLGPQFAVQWGRADPANPQQEHVQAFGANGSGKTHWLGKAYQERAYVYQGERTQIIVATKPADETLAKIGFPVAGNFRQLADKVREGERAVIFHPRTRLMGSARRRFHDKSITDLMDRIYEPGADVDLMIDDVGYAEKLPGVKDRMEMFLREGRSSGISIALLKQRPQGSNRLTSSETHWTVGFKPKDESDLERWAELFGSRRDYMPVMRSMDSMANEFLIKHDRTGLSFISWVDEPLVPVELPRRKRRLSEVFAI